MPTRQVRYFAILPPQAELQLQFTSETRKQLRQDREHFAKLIRICFFEVELSIDNEAWLEMVWSHVKLQHWGWRDKFHLGSAGVESFGRICAFEIAPYWAKIQSAGGSGARKCLPELVAQAPYLQLLLSSRISQPQFLWTDPLTDFHGAMLLLLGWGARHWNHSKQLCGLEPPWQVWKCAYWPLMGSLSWTPRARKNYTGKTDSTLSFFHAQPSLKILSTWHLMLFCPSPHAREGMGRNILHICPSPCAT